MADGNHHHRLSIITLSIITLGRSLIAGAPAPLDVVDDDDDDGYDDVPALPAQVWPLSASLNSVRPAQLSV